MTETALFTDNFYILDDGRVRQFLVTGEEDALLVDTGFEDSHVYETVRKITDLPVKVILTHGDRDHAGGLENIGRNLEDAEAPGNALLLLQRKMDGILL